MDIKFKIQPIDPNIILNLGFNPKDKKNIPLEPLPGEFDLTKDLVELHLYDLNGELIKSNYNFKEYSVSKSFISLNPEKFFVEENITRGEINILYNFISYELGSSLEESFYISEISPSRQEIKIKSNVVELENLKQNFDLLREKVRDSEIFDEFYIRFENNLYIIGINILLNEEKEEVLLKLYEPLPSEYTIKDQIWVVTKPAETIAFNVKFDEVFIPLETIKLKGPNYNIELRDYVNKNIDYKSYEEIINNSSLYLNKLKKEGVELNVDYSNFNEFVNFSSIYERLIKYKEKVENGVDSINFDDYEKYLHYNNIDPDTLLENAQIYDERNPDYLYYTVPEYIREDPQNLKYKKFIDLIGYHWDMVWLYTKNITEFLNSSNSLKGGVSLDMVDYILESYGIQIPQSNLDDIVLTNPKNQPSFLKDIHKEIYQRLYHNLPYLIRSKGTLESIKQIINIWGLPTTILNIVETKNPISDSDSGVYGEELSKFISISKPNYEVYDNIFDKKYNNLEVGFNVQGRINDEIIDHFGDEGETTKYISNVVGDPKNLRDKSTKYEGLKSAFKDVLSSYLENDDISSFIRLTHFFDNALFSIIKDFTPAKTSISTGIIVKPNILDRNKIPGFTNQLYSQILNLCLESKPGLEGVTKDYECYINYNLDQEIDEEGAQFNITESRRSTIAKEGGTDLGAEIPDSYYKIKRRTKPLFEGCFLESQDYNKWNENDISYGQTSVIDKYPRYISIYKGSYQSLEEFGTFTYILDFLVEVPNQPIEELMKDKEFDPKIVELGGGEENLYEVVNTFELNRECKVIEYPYSTSVDEMSLTPKKVCDIRWGGAEYECLVSNQYSPFSYPNTKVNRYLPFRRDIYKSYLKFPNFVSHKVYVSGSLEGEVDENNVKDLDFKIYLTGGEYQESAVSNIKENVSPPNQRVFNLYEESKDLPPMDGLDEEIESGSWGLADIYTFNKLLKDQYPEYFIGGGIYYDPRNLDEMVEIEGVLEEGEISYVFDYYKHPTTPFFPEKYDIIRSLVDEKVKIEFEKEGSGSVEIKNVEGKYEKFNIPEEGIHISYSMGETLELKAIVDEGWELEGWFEKIGTSEDEKFISNKDELVYETNLEGYPYSLENRVLFEIEKDIEPDKEGEELKSKYCGFEVKLIECNENFIKEVEKLEEGGVYEGIIDLSLFTYRRTHFRDNKLILNQPSTQPGTIKGIQTPPFKGGCLIPKDMSPNQKENINFILGKLREKGRLLSTQELGNKEAVSGGGGPPVYS